MSPSEAYRIALSAPERSPAELVLAYLQHQRDMRALTLSRSDLFKPQTDEE